MVHDGGIYARAYIATRLLSSQGPAPNREIFEVLGNPPQDLVLSEWVHEWRLSTALPSTRRPARHEWAG